VARLVVFDLDGTITRRGTLVPYVAGLLAKRPLQLLRLLRVVPALLAYSLGRIDRGELKGRLLRATLRGRGRAELATWTAQFVPRLVARGLRADALRAIESHRQRGDVLVLLSASPDLYVPAIAAQLDFAEAICTGLTWSGDRLDGGLATPNRRGAEKARCLAELAGRHPGLRTVAYGNDAADLEHLLEVDEPLLVCGSRSARRLAARAGVPSARWT
jgi:phosphatidylglycerophosphatase C